MNYQELLIWGINGGKVLVIGSVTYAAFLVLKECCNVYYCVNTHNRLDFSADNDVENSSYFSDSQEQHLILQIPSQQQNDDFQQPQVSHERDNSLSIPS